MKPLVVVNFKAYKEGLKKSIINLLDDYKNVVLSLPAPLIAEYDDKTRVFAQHVDPVDEGAYTGSVTAREIKAAGAKGSLVNHSERRIPFKDIKKVVGLLRKYKLKSIVCCKSVSEALRIKKLRPDYIAYEPPALIGGEISVSNAKPRVIKEIVDKAKPIKVLVGAGVKTKEDIRKSVELGAKGVLIASGILKASKDKIKELLS